MSRFKKKKNYTLLKAGLALTLVVGIGVGGVLYSHNNTINDEVIIPQWEYDVYEPKSYVALEKKNLLNSIPKPILKKIFLGRAWREAVLEDIKKIDDNYEVFVSYLSAIESYGGDYNAKHMKCHMKDGKKVCVVTARGRYQIIPDLAEELRVACNIKKEEMWEPHNQDAMFSLFTERNAESCVKRDSSFVINILTRWFMHNQGAKGGVYIWKYLKNGNSNLINPLILRNIANNVPSSFGAKKNKTFLAKVNSIVRHNYNIKKYTRLSKKNKTRTMALKKLKKLGEKKILTSSLVLKAYGYKTKDEVIKAYVTTYMTMLNNYVENGKLHK